MNIAIIAGGGSGTRLGGGTPKQFLNAGGVPIIIRCIQTFDRHGEIDEIITVCKPEYMKTLEHKAAEFGISKLKKIVPAGGTRRESVFNALRAVDDEDAIVLIHDGARPLVTSKIISDNIRTAEETGAAVTVVSASDTILKSTDGKIISGALNRGELYHAQTPQSFRYRIIMSAHMNAGQGEATDDCSLVLRAGCEVTIVPGNELNRKITVPGDLLWLETAIERL